MSANGYTPVISLGNALGHKPAQGYAFVQRPQNRGTDAAPHA
jgi:hypothetical protein